MWLATFWGGIVGSAVLLGAIVGIYVKMQQKWIAFIMAFGTGVLLGAASFELLNDAMEDGGVFATSIGFLGGASLFTIFELIIASKGGQHRKRSKANPVGHSGLAIFVGTVLDAIPESVILGVSLLQDNSVSWVLVSAIFISNFPEGLSSSYGLRQDGYTKSKILFLWFVVLILSALSSLTGYVLLENASAFLLSAIGAFAAGGIIAMVAATMMPEAFEDGGPIIGLVVALGLLTSLLLS